MDVVFNLLLISHLLALAVAAVTLIGMPIVLSRMGGATPEGRQMLGGIAARFSINSRIALGVLVLSGAAMVWVRYGGVEGMSEWFWVKMTLVTVTVAAMIASAVLPRGAINPKVLPWVTRLSLLGVVVAAVFAFS
jgi:hypothetical protein